MSLGDVVVYKFMKLTQIAIEEGPNADIDREEYGTTPTHATVIGTTQRASKTTLSHSTPRIQCLHPELYTVLVK